MRVDITAPPTGADAPVREETAPQEKGSPAASSPPSTGVEPEPGERPSWLPEKFKSPEDLVKAYSELEKQRGKPKEPGLTGKADPLFTPEDLETYSKEYGEKGTLTEDSYKALEAKGLPKNVIDSYIQGQIALAKTHQQAVFGVAGGEEGYRSLIKWANQNLSKQEAAAADAVLSSGDFGAIENTLKGLMARRTQAEGVLPNQVSGRLGAGSGVKPFGNWSEVSLAMRDPRYGSDTAYMKEVEERLAASKL